MLKILSMDTLASRMLSVTLLMQGAFAISLVRHGSAGLWKRNERELGKALEKACSFSLLGPQL